MNRKTSPAYFITSSLLLLGLALAADPGTAVFPLLKIGQGVRAAGMGESFTGLSDDASALYWNPAGLGHISAGRFALSHHEWFAGIRDEVGHAALPLGPGALGLGLVYTGEPKVRHWNESRQEFEELSTWGTALTAGYGWLLSDKYALGASAIGLYRSLSLETGLGGGLDLGFTGRPLSGFGFGLAARHLGAMDFGSGFKLMPAELALGGSYATDMFCFTLDGVVPALDNPPNVRLGVEFTPVEQLALRVGYRTGPVSLSSLGYASGLTAGIGVTFGGLGIDYALAPYGDLGLTHRIGLRLQTSPPTTGRVTLLVLDADTKKPISANLAVSGIYDTTAQADKLVLARAWPGEGSVRISLDEYEPRNVKLQVTAGKRVQDTVFLQKLTVAIAGGIYDAKTQKPIGGKLSYAGPSTAQVTVQADPGTFHLHGLSAGRYQLDATGPTDEYLAQIATLDLAAGKSIQQDFYLWKKGDLLSLEVNFETGKADILPQYYPILDRAGQVLKQTPLIRKVELGGHTDPRDIKTSEFPSNMALSKARAEAVMRYLVEKCGVEPTRLVAKGYADTKPVASNTTPEGMAKNRRTELKIIE